jgi:hypothetical protein
MRTNERDIRKDQNDEGARRKESRVQSGPGGYLHEALISTIHTVLSRPDALGRTDFPGRPDLVPC